MTTQRTMSTIAAACVTTAALLAAPLQASPAHAQSAPEKVSPKIPRGFDLDDGFVDYGSDGSQQGPSKRIRGLHLDPCFAVSWKPGRWKDRMVARNNGPETEQVRELLTFGKAQRAAKVVDRIRSDLANCPDGTTDDGGRPSTVKVYHVTTGYDDAIWSVTAGKGQIGGYIAQVMRVGTAVVLNYDSGEYSGKPRGGARALNRDSQELAPLLCRWTVAGC